MFKCEICGAVFDQPHVITERRPDADGYSEMMRYECCPLCGEGYFREYYEPEADPDDE